MADFGRFRITNGGIELEYKAQTGKELKFTKFTLGDGEYTGSIRILTDVVHKIMDMPIARIDIQEATTTKKVTIGFNLDTSQITTGFYLREIGLFAKDPDTNEEILVFYGNAGDTADYINPSSSSTVSEKLIDLEIYIDDAPNITAEISDSLIWASQDDVIRLTNKVNGIDVTEYATKVITTTLQNDNWVLNSETGYYDYEITDSTITSNHLVVGYLSISEQEKLSNSEINTIDGGIIISTTELPTQNIQITLAMSKESDAPGQSVPSYSYDYNDLVNKPLINGNRLQDNKTSSEIGVADANDIADITTNTINSLINQYF